MNGVLTATAWRAMPGARAGAPRRCTRNRVTTVVVLAAALLVAGTAPVRALHLPGRSSADRAAFDPLRQADLAAALDGRPIDAAWREAAAKLPARCAEAAAAIENGCTEEARCNWLSARAAVLEDLTTRHTTRTEVVERLRRAAQRVAHARCAGADERSAPASREAARDDARLTLAMLRALPAADDSSVLDPEDQRRVDALVAAARRGGIAAIDPDELADARDLLGRALERRTWLASVPALARLRALLPAAWSPVGSVPAECGGEILRNDLLEDQWRGFLVREAVPRALACIPARLAPLLARRGLVLSDPAAAAALARQLGEAAERDPGGRSFGADGTVLESIAQLARGVTAVSATDMARGSARRPAPSRAATSEATLRSNADPLAPAPSPRRGTIVAAAGTVAASTAGLAARAAAAATRTGGPPRGSAVSIRGDAYADRADSPSSRPDGASRPDPALVRLAGDVARYAGRAEPLRESAERARSSAEKSQVERVLLVELHHAVCGPLSDADPEDLDAVRRILALRGTTSHDAACRAEEGSAALRELLDASPGLLRVGAAVRIRAAARAFALGQVGEGRRVLELVPDAMRGTSWSVIAAWGARLDNDPVAATHLLARLPVEALDRLRSSGDEDVARLVTHASAQAQAW